MNMDTHWILVQYDWPDRFPGTFSALCNLHATCTLYTFSVYAQVQPQSLHRRCHHDLWCVTLPIRCTIHGLYGDVYVYIWQLARRTYQDLAKQHQWPCEYHRAQIALSVTLMLRVQCISLMFMQPVMAGKVTVENTYLTCQVQPAARLARITVSVQKTYCPICKQVYWPIGSC